MTSSDEVVVEAKGLWKSFDAGRIPVIRGVDLTVRRGEMVALWGTSGSGKSTLLHLLSGLDSPDRGTIAVLGLDPSVERYRLQLRRNHIGFVFQLHHLITDLTVEENLRIPALSGAPSKKERLRALAEEVGISHRLGHRVQDLSGGERQRASICRALVHNPDVLFADEPTGSLDETTGSAVFELLCGLAAKSGVAVVLATHERRFLRSCHRTLRVQEGKVVPYDAIAK